MPYPQHGCGANAHQQSQTWPLTLHASLFQFLPNSLMVDLSDLTRGAKHFSPAICIPTDCTDLHQMLIKAKFLGATVGNKIKHISFG